MIKEKANALLIIDVQNDFCPGGALAVKEGDKIIPLINSIQNKFYKVVATQDWHPHNHISFASNHPGKKVYDEIDINNIKQVLWPDHCLAGTKGAEFHPALNIAEIHLILRKGTDANIDSYSAFMENDKKTFTGLEGYLKSLNIKQVFIVGLATDYCVYYTAMDALRLGFETYVIIDACRGVDVPEGNIQRVICSMQNNGIKVIELNDI
jgi:nicotinamidase/pyrazinamidase